MHGDGREGAPGQGLTVDMFYPAGKTTMPVVRSASVCGSPTKFFFMDSIGITLTAKATMRLEQPALDVTRSTPTTLESCT